MSYEEFKKNVPKETQDYINKLLRYIYYYVSYGYSVNNDGLTTISSDYAKAFYLGIIVASFDMEMKNIFYRFGFNVHFFHLDEDIDKCTKKKNLEELYNKYGYLVLPKFSNYRNLTIYDILIYMLDNLNDYLNRNGIHNAFVGFCKDKDCSLSNFRKLLKATNISKKEEQTKKEEQELFEGLRVDVISYLEVASKIYYILMSKSYKEGFKPIDSDYTPLALFLALYYYKDPIIDEDGISFQKVLVGYFENKGLTLSRIYQTMGAYQIRQDDIQSKSSDIQVIKEKFSKYFQENGANASVLDVVKKIFNRSFTNSLLIEKIMAQLNCYVGMFDNLEKDLKDDYQRRKKLASDEYVKSFYKDLSREVKEFINYTAKIYTLLLKKMENKGHNQELLTDEDDADTLALLIASYFYGADVSLFYLDYGISLEDIFNLIGIHLTREEIDKQELNKKHLVSRYKRFIQDGVNSNKSSKNITVNDVAHNLCSSAFNRSSIMEDIFYGLSSKGKIDNDFLKLLQNHFKQKEKRRKIELTQKVYQGLKVDVIEYLEGGSKVHNYFVANSGFSNYRSEDIRIIVLFISLFMIPNEQIKDFLKYLGFERELVLDYFEISDYRISDLKPDIDVISSDYISYIDGIGERKDITIDTIAKNLLVNGFKDSVFINRMLSSFKLSCEDFNDYDKLYQDYLKYVEESRLAREEEAICTGYYDSRGNYVELALRILKRIKDEFDKKGIKSSLITNDDDIAELSLLLSALIQNNNSKRFFEKNGINLEFVLLTCGLDSSILDNIQSENMDYSLGARLFRKYLERDLDSAKYYIHSETIIKRIFESGINSSLLLETICVKAGASYDILREEVISEKDYESTLSIEDRINLITNQPIEELRLDDHTSILRFGNPLALHSKYIHDELPKLDFSEELDKSMQTVQNVVDKVYQKSETLKPKSFWEKLFSLDVPDKPKESINPEALSELREVINASAGDLSKEIYAYDSIRRYMEAYRAKNQLYYKASKEAEKTLEEEIAKLDPNSDADYDKLIYLNSLLQVIRSKIQRFITTNYIIKQELLRLNRTLTNHHMTIIALEMARDDLIPLIGSEIAISHGLDTEKDALKISKGASSLLISLLNHNVADTAMNMGLLRDLGLPNELYETLNSGVGQYLSTFNSSLGLDEPMDVIDDDEDKLVNKLLEDEKSSSPKKDEISHSRQIRPISPDSDKNH